MKGILKLLTVMFIASAIIGVGSQASANPITIVDSTTNTVSPVTKGSSTDPITIVDSYSNPVTIVD